MKAKLILFVKTNPLLFSVAFVGTLMLLSWLVSEAFNRLEAVLKSSGEKKSNSHIAAVFLVMALLVYAAIRTLIWNYKL